MGILANIFVSNNEEALKFHLSWSGDRTQHISKYNPVELSNLTDLEFSTLWSTLKNEKWDIDTHELEQIEVYSEGEAWLFKFPNTLCELFINLDSKHYPSIAEIWVKTEELEMTGWTTADAVEVITVLVNACKEAEAKNLDVYLCGSV